MDMAIWVLTLQIALGCELYFYFRFIRHILRLDHSFIFLFTKAMKFQDLHHDEAVLQELGRRVTQIRIDLDLSQAELAKQAGIGKRTLERLESGETTQTRTLFRIFRELGLLGKMEVLLPEPTARPSHMIKDTDALPRRVPRKKTDKASTKEWRWGDES